MTQDFFARWFVPIAKPMTAFILLFGLSAAAITPTPLNKRKKFVPAGDYSEAALQYGVFATEKDCATRPNNAVWAVTSLGSECIKYWIAGFKTTTTRAVVYLHGDVWDGVGGTSAAYKAMTEAKMQQDATAWSTAINSPVIYIARPGTYGSSGDHMQRRRPVESLLVSAALDKIKAKLKLKEFTVAGQSGGGHVTASLLTRRSDIVCAVPTSSPSSPRLRAKIRGWSVDSTGYTDSYEPVDHLNRLRMHPSVRVFVMGDRNDANVPWKSQEILHTGLTAIKVASSVINKNGTGSSNHGLSRSSRIIAGYCNQGVSTAEILRLAQTFQE